MANQQPGRKTPRQESRRPTGPWLGRSLVQPAVLGLFHRFGVLNGARLGEVLGVGRSSAHLILDRLSREGCLVVEGRRMGEPMPPGRPTTDYRLNPAHGSFLGVHLGPSEVEWASVAFDGGTTGGGGVSAAGTLMDPEGIVPGVAAALAAAAGQGWAARALHVGVSVSGGHEERRRGAWSIEELADALATQLKYPGLRVVAAASAGATAESIRIRSTPEPTLFAIVQEDFLVPVGFACGGLGVSGRHRRASSIESVAKRRALWLAKAPAKVAAMTWTELAGAAEQGGLPSEMHAALVDELAEELAKFASFLDASRVVVGGGAQELIGRLMPILAREVPLRAGNAGARPPEVVAAESAPSPIALGAALAPVASAITRSFEFEANSRAGESGSSVDRAAKSARAR